VKTLKTRGLEGGWGANGAIEWGGVWIGVIRALCYVCPYYDTDTAESGNHDGCLWC